MQSGIDVGNWRRWFHLSIIAAIIILRNPDALFHPQFWAEDGTLWYRDAYNIGAAALVHPALGYLQTIARLSAFLGTQFPLAWVPAIYAMIAFFIQVLPAGLLLSKRFDQELPTWLARLAIAYYYALVPNSYEWNMNVTNAQWHLAFAALLIIIGRSARTRAWQIVDASILLISGLSGPFCIFYAPLAVWEVSKDSTKLKVTYAVLALGCAIVQLYFLFTTISSRPAVHLDASFPVLCSLLSHQILFGGIFGANLSGLFLKNSLLNSNWVAVFLTSSAFVLLLFAFKIGPSAYRKALFFVLFLLASALIRPATQENTWLEMSQLGNCDCYFVGPILLVTTLLVLMSSTSILQKTATALVFLSFLGVLIDFHFAKNFPTNFASNAAQFADAKAGTVMVFPENPIGWSMVLTKKQIRRWQEQPIHRDIHPEPFLKPLS